MNMAHAMENGNPTAFTEQFSQGLYEGQPDQQNVGLYVSDATELASDQWQHTDDQQHIQGNWPNGGLGLYSDLSSEISPSLVLITRSGSDASSTGHSSMMEFPSAATTSSSMSLPFSYHYDPGGDVSFRGNSLLPLGESLDPGLGPYVVNHANTQAMFTDWHGFNDVKSIQRTPSDVCPDPKIRRFSSESDFNHCEPTAEPYFRTHDTAWLGITKPLLGRSTSYSAIEGSEQRTFYCMDRIQESGHNSNLGQQIDSNPLTGRKEEEEVERMRPDSLSQGRHHKEVYRGNSNFVQQLWE